MARAINKLTARQVSTVTKPGKYMDGGGLRLVVANNGSKKWVFRYTRDGKTREAGLGAASGANAVSLADARKAAEDMRRTLTDDKQDPLEKREKDKALRVETEKAAALAEKTAARTFETAAKEYMNTHLDSFRNPKHQAQWRMTLREYAKPLLKKPVAEIGTDLVLEALKQIWQTKPETASRTRGRIEKVLDAEKAAGHRSGENPARWKGHLENLLPKPKKLSRGHHAAMPYAAMPDFMETLRAVDSVSAWALEFTILTAARSGEVLGAQWSEIDVDAKVWTVPGERMKAGREHRVPLCDRALEVLALAARLREADGDGFVFPGAKKGRGLSVMALTMALRRLEKGEFTVHGFRSAFRDWAAEETNFAREVAEAALAHVVGDATERAYRRGDALEKRRVLMTAWEAHCGSAASDRSNIVPMAARA